MAPVAPEPASQHVLLHPAPPPVAVPARGYAARAPGLVPGAPGQQAQTQCLAPRLLRCQVMPRPSPPPVGWGAHRGDNHCGQGPHGNRLVARWHPPDPGVGLTLNSCCHMSEFLLHWLRCHSLESHPHQAPPRRFELLRLSHQHRRRRHPLTKAAQYQLLCHGRYHDSIRCRLCNGQAPGDAGGLGLVRKGGRLW